MTDKQIPNERRQYEYKSVFTYTDNTTDDNDKIMENLHKQITIDVTQCPYYREGKSCVYLPYKTKCEGDCNWTSYKEMEEQLKRAEQHIVELNKTIKVKEQECEELKNEYWKLEQGNDFLAEKNSKLKGCLTEIKEIAEDESYIGFWDEQISEILQKISKCGVCNDQ